MFGFVAKLGTTKGLKALGVDEGTAKVIGWLVWGVVTVATFDASSVLVEAVPQLLDGSMTLSEVAANVGTELCANVTPGNASQA